MTPTPIAHLRELLAKATPAEKWETAITTSEYGSRAARGPWHATGVGSAEQRAEADRALIAAMRNALPALLAELEAAREVVKAARQLHSDVINTRFLSIDELVAWAANYLHGPLCDRMHDALAAYDRAIATGKGAGNA